MALSASRLASALEAGIRSAEGLDATPYPGLTAFCNAVATAVVSEITGNAVVTVDKASASINLSVPSVPNTQTIQPTSNPTGSIT